MSVSPNIVAPTGLNLAVIDGSFSDFDYQHLVPKIASYQELPERLWDVESFVRILQGLTERTLQKVMRLQIIAMGNLEGFWLGKSWVSAATLPQHAQALGKLRDSFASPQSAAQILAHENGLSAALRKNLATLWGIERVDGELTIRMPLDHAGPRGLAANAYKLRTISVRFENAENMANSIFYW